MAYIIDQMDRSTASTFEALSGPPPFWDMLPTAARYELSGDTNDGESTRGDFLRAYDALVSYILERVSRVSVDDLGDAIDLLLEDPNYHAKRRGAFRLLPWSVMQEQVWTRDIPDVPPDTVPNLVADRVQQALRTEHVLTRQIVRALAQLESEDSIVAIAGAPDHTTEFPRTADLLQSRMPARIRAAMIAHRVGEICGFALMSARVTSTALADALADRWLHGLRSVFAIVAAYTGELPDESLLPRSYAFSLEGAISEEVTARRGAIFAATQVESTGKGFPEVYVADDED